MSSTTALLIIDVQNANLTRVPSASITYLPLLARTITHARNNNIVVIYVTVSFRAGHPECHTRNRTFGKLPVANLYVEGTEAVAIPEEIKPLSTDITITKRRVSAFHGTDLAVVLRSLNIETLVLAGLSTSGAILSTMKEACDRDFAVVVLKDLCLDPDAEVQRVVMEKVIARHAEAVGCESWMNGV